MTSEIIFALIQMSVLLTIICFGTYRFWRVITDKTIETKGSVSIFGYGGLLLLGMAILVFWGTLIFTIFFMKTGGASGIPLAIALIIFPVVWIISEVLIAIGFKKHAQVGSHENPWR